MRQVLLLALILGAGPAPAAECGDARSEARVVNRGERSGPLVVGPGAACADIAESRRRAKEIPISIGVYAQSGDAQDDGRGGSTQGGVGGNGLDPGNFGRGGGALYERRGPRRPPFAEPRAR